MREPIRYTDKTERPLDHFPSALLRLLGVQRGVLLLRDRRASCGAGVRFGVSILGGQRAKNKSHLASASIGVIWIRSASPSKRQALAGSGALSVSWSRQLAHSGRAWPPPSWVIGRVLDSAAPLLGIVPTPLPSRALDRCGAHSSGGITPNGAVAPAVLCDHVAALRGSFGTVMPTSEHASGES